MDRGAWQAVVHRVSKSQTQWKRLSMHTDRGERGHSRQRKQHEMGTRSTLFVRGIVGRLACLEWNIPIMVDDFLGRPSKALRKFWGTIAPNDSILTTLVGSPQRAVFSRTFTAPWSNLFACEQSSLLSTERGQPCVVSVFDPGDIIL